MANPRVMRDMPYLLQAADLELVEADGVLYADVGSGDFWPNAAETYGVVLKRFGRIPPDAADRWQAFQRSAVGNGTFFGASNYDTSLARRRG
ncbi:hypothetical protein [Geodermatophilus sp. CPCC 205506]|uniref:hypothetical protein n=1 Tax=Geodermatophilus sp. CPCC 205506 TaxID=2936596 RepID=UPI003EEC4616